MVHHFPLQGGFHARTDQQRKTAPTTSRHCFLHLQIKKINSLKQQYAMCRVRDLYSLQISGTIFVAVHVRSRGVFAIKVLPSIWTRGVWCKEVIELTLVHIRCLTYRLPVNGIHRLYRCTVRAAAAASSLHVCQTRRDGETESRHHSKIQSPLRSYIHACRPAAGLLL